MKIELFGGMVLATAALVIRFVAVDRPLLAIAALISAMLWLPSTQRGWRRLVDGGLVLYAALSVLAVLVDISTPLWGLPPLLGALLCWNAATLDRLLSQADRVIDVPRLVSRARLRLYGTLLVGAALALIAMFLRLNLSFGAAMLLALAAMLGLSRAIAFLRQAGA